MIHRLKIPIWLLARCECEPFKTACVLALSWFKLPHWMTIDHSCSTRSLRVCTQHNSHPSLWAVLYEGYVWIACKPVKIPCGIRILQYHSSVCFVTTSLSHREIWLRHEAFSCQHGVWKGSCSSDTPLYKLKFASFSFLSVIYMKLKAVAHRYSTNHDTLYLPHNLFLHLSLQ